MDNRYTARVASRFSRGFAAWTAAVAIAGGAACSRGTDSGEAAGETIAVTVQQARLGSLRDFVSVSGNVVPSAAADFIVTASEPAEIVELPKNEGDTVQPGDLLVRLELPALAAELATRQLELSEAVARAEAARADEARLDSLVKQGLAARNKLEAARTAKMAADEHLAQVRARVESAKTAEGVSTIRARFTGIVAKRWHMPGDRVLGGEGDPILRVVDPTRLQIAVQIPQDKADRIQPNQPAMVQTPAGPAQAVVAMKGMATGESPASVEVRLGFVTPSTLSLDTIVQAEIVLEELQDVLLIPAAAVQRDDSGPFVWLATDAGTATRRSVRTGISVTGQTQVLSGLSPGDPVIVTGIALLSEGTPISISK